MDFLSRARPVRRTYGLDEIALVPAGSTLDPADVSTAWSVGEIVFEMPIVASAMDSVTDVRTAVALGRAGGVAVLNLEGVQTRYEDPDEALDRVTAVPAEAAVRVLQEVYRPPVRDDLVRARIAAIKAGGAVAAVSVTPAGAQRLAPVAVEAGADVLVLQSTVVTASHRSSRGNGVAIASLIASSRIPVMVGNTVTHDAAMALLEAGAAGLFVGVGPGAACTSRRVLGVGVPQATAIAEVAAARDEYRRRSGRYVPLVADGGIAVGGDVAKAIACGADAVMLGSALAKAEEAPGRGFHWGMATPHAALPRGTRIRVGTAGTLQQILFGPAQVDDGSQNLVEALRTAMGACGAATIEEMHQVEIVVAPELRTEGKAAQFAQKVGQGR